MEKKIQKTVKFYCTAWLYLSFKLHNVAQLSSDRTGGNSLQVSTENENFTVMCSRTLSTKPWVWSFHVAEYGGETHLHSSRCRGRRVCVKSLTLDFTCDDDHPWNKNATGLYHNILFALSPPPPPVYSYQPTKDSVDSCDAQNSSSRNVNIPANSFIQKHTASIDIHLIKEKQDKLIN